MGRGQPAECEAIASIAGGENTDVLNAGRKPQLGFLQQPFEPAVVPVRPFGVDDHAKTLFKGEREASSGCRLCDQGVRHAVNLHLA
jgi:hypothetical protein